MLANRSIAHARALQVDEAELPVTLPVVESYQPTGTGASPLASAEGWVQHVDPQGRRVRRETLTMPQWAGSCWCGVSCWLLASLGHV